MAGIYFQNINEVTNCINYVPKRIVSLVPSQTELLVDIGLEERLVGITKFCVHPATLKQTKKVIGGTKNINISTLLSLKPDLVIANKEENTQESIEAIAAFVPVWVTDIATVADALNMIKDIGKITQATNAAAALIENIEASFSELLLKQITPVKTAYLIWRKPYITIGGDTFISDILQKIGYENVFANYNRYPTITINDLQEKQVDQILLSSEPYPFNEKHINELKTLIPAAKIKLIDGEMCSWYGSRMLQAAKYLQAYTIE